MWYENVLDLNHIRPLYTVSSSVLDLSHKVYDLNDDRYNSKTELYVFGNVLANVTLCTSSRHVSACESESLALFHCPAGLGLVRFVTR